MNSTPLSSLLNEKSSAGRHTCRGVPSILVIRNAASKQTTLSLLGTSETGYQEVLWTTTALRPQWLVPLMHEDVCRSPVHGSPVSELSFLPAPHTAPMWGAGRKESSGTGLCSRRKRAFPSSTLRLLTNSLSLAMEMLLPASFKWRSRDAIITRKLLVRSPNHPSFSPRRKTSEDCRKFPWLRSLQYLDCILFLPPMLSKQ